MKNMFLPQAKNAAMFAFVGSPIALLMTAAAFVAAVAAVILLLFFRRR